LQSTSLVPNVVCMVWFLRTDSFSMSRQIFWQELCHHLTQCGLGWGLLPYQVASSSIQPFDHNRHGPKSVIEFFFYLLQLRCYKAKRVKTCCYQEGVGHLEPRFQGEVVVPGEYFFGFYKTRHILLSNSANCTVLRAIVLTQYWRVTDGQTDGIVLASTALVMRALWRAVKTA